MLSDAPTPTSTPSVKKSAAAAQPGASASKTSSAAALAGDRAVAVLGPISSVTVVVAAGFGLVVVEDYARDLVAVQQGDGIEQCVALRLARACHQHHLPDQ